MKNHFVLFLYDIWKVYILNSIGKIIIWRTFNSNSCTLAGCSIYMNEDEDGIDISDVPVEILNELCLNAYSGERVSPEYANEYV